MTLSSGLRYANPPTAVTIILKDGAFIFPV